MSNNMKNKVLVISGATRELARRFCINSRKMA